MRPITFARRGRRDDAPETTLEAFARALELGAAGLESGVRLSADGEAVLAHAPHVRQGLRRLAVASTPAARLAEAGIPRLADLFDALGCGFELSLDLRDPAAAEAVLRAARAAGAAGRLWVCAPDVEVLVRVRAADPDVRLVHSMGRRRYGDTLEPHVAALVREGVAALNLHEREWSGGLVALVHRFGVSAFAGDVQETRRLRALLAMDIDAVSSDHVDRMVATVGEWSGNGDGH